MALLVASARTRASPAVRFLYLGLEEVVWRNYIQIHTGVLGLLIVMLLLFLPTAWCSRAGMFGRKTKHV